MGLGVRLTPGSRCLSPTSARSEKRVTNDWKLSVEECQGMETIIEGRLVVDVHSQLKRNAEGWAVAGRRMIQGTTTVARQSVI